jgi:hypothetical protein
MKIEELKQIKDRRPFVPFTIVTGDGREIPIRHPDAVAWDDTRPRLALAVSGGNQYWIDVALITVIHSPIPAQPADDAGAARG